VRRASTTRNPHATNSSVSFPGTRSHLGDPSIKAETRQFDRGTDDLARIARPVRVIRFGERIEHTAMPPRFGHQRTSRRLSVGPLMLGEHELGDTPSSWPAEGDVQRRTVPRHVGHNND
jgi:hypothetical protein